MQYTFHKVAEIFPLMEGEEFVQLVEDIRQHGLRNPLLTYQSQIIDGRNRYLACQKANVEPHYSEWVGGESLVDYVWSLNYPRRHLTPGQKAMCAVEYEKAYAEEAKERRLAALKKGTQVPVVEAVSPGPRLELFGRRTSPGWVVYGNECE